MKKIITLFIVLTSLVMQAQKTYVKITRGENVLYYPPGTQFDLKNPHGYIILKYSETPRVEKIDGNYQLIVSPNWKDEKEIIKLTKGDQVELVLTEDFGKVEMTSNTYQIEKAILASKEVTDSKKIEGKKNLTLELNNGIKFVYEDGTYYAKLKKKYIDIEGKYIVKTKLGILKLSFNPNSGVVWWVFEEGN